MYNSILYRSVISIHSIVCIHSLNYLPAKISSNTSRLQSDGLITVENSFGVSPCFSIVGCSGQKGLKKFRIDGQRLVEVKNSLGVVIH